MFTIYLITNSANNKKYVGVTSQKLKARIKGHRDDARRKNGVLQLAIRKYGFDVFNFETLEIVESEEDAFAKETFYIRELNTKVPSGYNMTDGGEGTFGRKLTEEHIQKIADTRSKWCQEKKLEIEKRISNSVKKAYAEMSNDKKRRRAKKISNARKEYFKNRSDEEARIVNNKIKATLQKTSRYSKSCSINGKEFVSYSEAGRYMGVSSDTIRRRIKSDKFPGYKNE